MNTDFYITGWMLCVITHIDKDLIDNYNGNNRKEVNNIIKTLFYRLSDDVFACYRILVLE